MYKYIFHSNLTSYLVNPNMFKLLVILFVLNVKINVHTNKIRKFLELGRSVFYAKYKFTSAIFLCETELKGNAEDSGVARKNRSLRCF